MKTTLLLLLFLLPFCLFSQTRQTAKSGYRPGGIISRNNDTILVDIKLESIYLLQNEVKFIDESGKKKSFKPNIINGFYFDTEDEKMVFESRNDIRVSALAPKYGYFINRVTNDVCPLYYFVNHKMVNVGIESNMVNIPYYLILKNGNWEYISSESFDDCVNVFKDDAALVNDIKADKYSFNDIPEMVKRYCKSVKKK